MAEERGFEPPVLIKVQCFSRAPHSTTLALLQKNYIFNLLSDKVEDNWKVDHKRLRIYLCEKYSGEEAYYFLGYISEQAHFYRKRKDPRQELKRPCKGSFYIVPLL